MKNHIGKRIKMLRQSRGMTQQQLGDILGVGKAAVQKYEANPNPNLTAEKILLLSRTFRVFPRVFIYTNDEEFWSMIFNMSQQAFDALNREYSAMKGKTREMDDMFGSRFLEMNRNVLQLNAEGFSRVEALVRDLAKIDEYRIKPAVNQGGQP